MKEIRFRAWTGKDMVLVHTLELAPNSMSCRVNLEFEISYDKLMQFTGLKHNSVDVYEGDIFNDKRDKLSLSGGYVSGTYGYHRENAKVVEWRNGGFYVGHESLYDFLCFIRHPGHHKDLIGNIHQNPDLIT